MGLFAVLIGLAIADIATSFHRLVCGKTPVVWDPLALLAAAFALCMAIGMWFDLWGVRGVTETRHFFFYLFMVSQMFVLFLIAAASLPDEPERPSNLRDFYAENRRYFWSLIALFQLGYAALGIYFLHSLFSRMPRAVVIVFFTQMIILFGIPLLLVAMKSRIVHYVGLGLLFVVTAWHYAPYSIN
ncbi:MAG TPA: hypothetical protein VK820_10245 [Steroidobacteraceae bacterium]|nr:hypothetical protein [Steroidobacteraceae bacterium]